MNEERPAKAPAKTGGHVSDTAAAGCHGCGHPLTMHSNGRTPCRAAACHAGPDGGPCPGFTADAGEHAEGILLAS